MAKMFCQENQFFHLHMSESPFFAKTVGNLCCQHAPFEIHICRFCFRRFFLFLGCFYQSDLPCEQFLHHSFFKSDILVSLLFKRFDFVIHCGEDISNGKLFLYFCRNIKRRFFQKLKMAIISCIRNMKKQTYLINKQTIITS